MTERATLQALLARVLEGTGPDRELDAEIWRIAEPATFTAPHGLYCKPWRYIGNGVWRDDSDLEGYNKAFAPPFTASLDAALTLVPEGWGWARTPQGDKVLVAVFIDIPLPDGSWRSEWIGEIHADDKRALIAACLKARMEAQGE